MSYEELTNAVKKSKKDTFEMGTVVKWTALERFRYAAIKTEVGWATTAQINNGYVEKVLTFKGLLEVLSREETSEVMVSESWISITGESATSIPVVERETPSLNLTVRTQGLN